MHPIREEFNQTNKDGTWNNVILILYHNNIISVKHRDIIWYSEKINPDSFLEIHNDKYFRRKKTKQINCEELKLKSTLCIIFVAIL